MCLCRIVYWDLSWDVVEPLTFFNSQLTVRVLLSQGTDRVTLVCVADVATPSAVWNRHGKAGIMECSLPNGILLIGSSARFSPHLHVHAGNPGLHVLPGVPSRLHR